MKHLLKKAFLLLALVGGVNGAWADATKIFDAANAGWSEGGVDLTSGTTTVGDVTWNGGGSAAIADGKATIEEVSWDARLKFGGKSTFKSGKTLARVLTFTPSTAGTVKVYGVHGSSSGTRTFYISQSITSTDRDVTTALGSFACTPENKSGVATAVVEKGKMVYIWCDDNIGIYGVTFEGSAAGPSISASDASIKATESGVEVTEDIAVTGANLTGSTLTATLSPAVDGLSVVLGSNTITDGAISTTATLHYTQTVNAKGSTTLTLSDGTTSKDVTVNYKSLVAPTELIAVSSTSATTLDLSKVGTGLETVTPDDYVVLTDAGSEVSFADQLAVKGIGTLNVTWRNDAVQAGFFKFKTTVPGTVTVKFSDTGGTAGGDRAPRYANINGTRSDVSSNGSGGDGAQVTCSPIAVSAGEVIIKGEQYNSGEDNYTDNQIRVFTISFTPAVSTTITSAGWSTLYTPYALDFSGVEGLTAYTATCSNYTVGLTKVDNVPANTGVVLKGAEGNYNIPVIASSETAQGDLKGSATEATAYNAFDGYTLYVLTAVGENVQFNPVTSGSINAGKAFLKVSGGASSARSMEVVVADDVLTGINEAKSEVKAAKEGKFVVDGQLRIFSKGKMFNAAGQLVK